MFRFLCDFLLFFAFSKSSRRDETKKTKNNESSMGWRLGQTRRRKTNKEEAEAEILTPRTPTVTYPKNKIKFQKYENENENIVLLRISVLVNGQTPAMKICVLEGFATWVMFFGGSLVIWRGMIVLVNV